MILEVISAVYLTDYRLKLIFNTEMERLVDLSLALKGKIFEPLEDKKYFMDFFIDCGTISWKNGADFAPEFLFFLSKPINFDQESEAEKNLKSQMVALYKDSIFGALA
jgi:hypothetical protein